MNSTCRRCGVVLLLGAVSAWRATSAAEIAFFYSTCQEQQFAYMPGEYAGQYNAAGAVVREAGFDWERMDSRAVENGELRRQGFKVLLISYTGVMSRAEAVAIADFAKAGGKVLAIYSSCAAEWRDGKAGEPGPGLLADVLGMESAGTEAGARNLRTLDPGSPLLRRLPLCLFNPHGYAVRMAPRPGTKVVANWTSQDFAAPAFEPANSGALLVSPTAVCFTGFLWRLPEARTVVANALSFLLGREPPADDVAWPRCESAAAVAGGLNLRYAKTETEDINAVGLQLGAAWHGISRPTCAVVYPVGAPESYYAAKRLAAALACPLVPDRAAQRDRLDRLYDIVAVGLLLPDRCENALGNLQRGVAQVLAEYAGAKSLAVLRQAPVDPATHHCCLLVGGTDLAGLMRAEAIVRQGVAPPLPSDATGLLIWQPASGFGDLVYPWTQAGAPVTALTLPAAVNQQARTQLVLTASRVGPPLDLDLRLSALSGPAGAVPPARTALLATRYLTSNVTKIDEPDPLVPATHVALAPGSHQQVWLRVDCTDLAPGTYTGSLAAVDAGGTERGRLAVTVDVAQITLSPRNRHELLTTVWDYALSGYLHGSLLDPAAGSASASHQANRQRWGNHYEQHFRQHWRAYVDDLEAHGINVMFLATPACMPQYQTNGRQLDEEVLGKLVPYARQHGFRQFIFTQILGQGCYDPDSDRIAGPGVPTLSPGWDEAYRTLLRAYVGLTQRLGLQFAEWAIYPFDEPHCDHDRQLINHVAGLIDQVEPRIQLWADPMRSQEKGLSTLDFWQSMASSIDIWWPADGYIPSGSDTLAYLRGLGKPFGFYNCAAYNTKNRVAVQPDRYYRSFGFKVVERGAAGMGFWTWCAWLGDSWDDEDDATRDGDGAVVYEGHEGPVTSLGWEAWSEGLDDYKYVAALRKAIAAREAAGGKDDARCLAARQLLDEAVAVAVKDIRQADTQRLRLRTAILELGKQGGVP